MQTSQLGGKLGRNRLPDPAHSTLFTIEEVSMYRLYRGILDQNLPKSDWTSYLKTLACARSPIYIEAAADNKFYDVASFLEKI